MGGLPAPAPPGILKSKMMFGRSEESPNWTAAPGPVLDSTHGTGWEAIGSCKVMKITGLAG